MMKRNDVVMHREPELMRLYGRVVRIIDDHALWICCGLHIHLTPIVQLDVTDYKGKNEWCPYDDGMMTA